MPQDLLRHLEEPMQRLTAVALSCGLLLPACGSEQAPKPPGKSNSRIIEVSTDRDAKQKDADAEKNGDDPGKDADIELEPVDIGGDSDSATYAADDGGENPTGTPMESPLPDDGKTAGKPAPSGDITPGIALTVTTVKKRKRDVRAFVQSGSQPPRELLWPHDEDAVAATEGLCFKGQATAIRFKIYSEDKGDLLPGSAEVGILKVGPDSIEIGYEENGCSKDFCQNDNVIRLHCPDGIRLAQPL
jgi:hypothetical protein